MAKAVQDHFAAEILEAQRATRALARDEQPEDLVGATFFLASEDAGFITRSRPVRPPGARFIAWPPTAR